MNNKLIWFMPRSGSTAYGRMLAKKYDLPYIGEAFGSWSDSTSSTGIYKVQSEQLVERMDEVLLMKKRSDVYVLMPRPLIDSYTSFILSYSHAAKNWDDTNKWWDPIWAGESKDTFRQKFRRVSYNDAIIAVDKYTSIASDFLKYTPLFLQSNIVDNTAPKSTIVWNQLNDKIKLIDNWAEVNNLIMKKGKPIWEQIQSLLVDKN